MKVWILTPEFFPYQWTDMGYTFQILADVLTRRGHEVTVFILGEDWDEEYARERPYRVREVPLGGEIPREALNLGDAYEKFPYNVVDHWSAVSYTYARVVEEAVEEEGAPDIIEVGDYRGVGYFLLQRRALEPDFLRDVPVVVSLHTAFFIRQAENEQARWKTPAFWTGEREKAVLLGADGWISPGRRLLERVEADLPAVDIPKVVKSFWGTSRSAPQRLDGPDDGFTVGYFGSVEPGSGVEELLGACVRLWNEGVDFRLRCWAHDCWIPGEEESILDTYRERYGRFLEDGLLVFEPAVVRGVEFERMLELDCVVFPEKWSGFSIRWVQAMAAEMLILSTASGGKRDFFGENGEGAVYFDWSEPGDFAAKLKEVLQLSGGERHVRGRAAREQVEGTVFWSEFEDRHLAFYEEVRRQFVPRSLFSFVTPRLRPGRISEGADAGEEAGRVSVIIPFYNLGEFVEEAVSSVLASDHGDFEVLLLDDGSTDEASRAVVEGLEAGNDPRLRVVRKANEGLARTRNRGAAMATGEYLAFVDADDAVEPGFLRTCVAVLERFRNVHFVTSWTRFCGDNVGMWITWNPEFPVLLGHNLMMPLCVVRRSSFLAHGRNNPAMKYGLEDHESWIRMVGAGCGGVSIPEALARYRVRGNSMFQSIGFERSLFLYDVIVRENAELYREYGDVLFQLQNANGPAAAWNHPAGWESPYRVLLNRLERKERGEEEARG